MAIIRRILTLLILSLTINKINAAVIPPSNDLESTPNNVEFAKEQEHVTVNESKVIIDLYSTSLSAHETHSNEASENATQTIKTPFLQVVINQPEVEATPRNEQNSMIETSTTQKPSVNSATPQNAQQLLIPPATVNANIAQLPNPAEKHKQGQIIIR